ncbi:hypothetical protein I4U23_007798 [Adineta vaga]|nr:hypothetical protein I4U23_007798 [Adineta vaga]
MASRTPTGSFQRPIPMNNQPTTATISPLKPRKDQNSSTPFFLKRPSISSELVVHIDKTGIVTKSTNDYTYRTEDYLQQREKLINNQSMLVNTSKTTWKNVVQQKRTLENDQAEIDRVLSTIDSIHGSFNRSLFIPYNQAYSSLYGDDDKSTHLMKTFCQSQHHYMKGENPDHTQETSNSFGFCQDTDSDADSSEDEEDDDDEKKKSYDSGYGSVMPRRRFPRESLVKNMDEHSTSHYDIPGLVLRRGQPFSFTVTFNRDFEAEQYQIYVRLAIGARSMMSKRTQIRLLVDGTPTGNGWAAKKIPTEGEEDKKKNNRISLQVDSPSDAIIGKYTLLLEVRPLQKENQEPIDKQDLQLFIFEVDIYFLFNPWKKEDACALSSPEQIAEYVMNEHGQIFLGSSDKPRPVPWYFGQFERSALHTALTLLDNAQLPPQNRVDPSIILRILASKICSNPGSNNGIFSSAFNVRPVTPEKNGLTSSTSILKHYLGARCRSAHGGSGTNWQHAAILCTLSRALGIPCRVVTIYNAACRTDGTPDNDVHWDAKQRPLQKLNSDFICSAHVWNECWMRRSDLPNNEQDWQIIDSTPVPMCDGIRRTGPCPVSTVKKGELGYRWDSPYIYSSVNGNKSHWIVYPDGFMELTDVQENQIGTKVITRSLSNEFEPEDITASYKNFSTSTEEHETLNNRLKTDVNFEVLISEENRFGEVITLDLNVHNKSNESRSITTALTLCIASGAGPKSGTCIDQPIHTLNLESGKDEIIHFKINPQQYLKYGPQDNIVIKYFIHSNIKETGQIFTCDNNVIFIKDDVIKPVLNEDVIEIGKPILMKIHVSNTLSRPLNNGRIYIDGLGLNQVMRVNFSYCICYLNFSSRSFAPKESTVLRIRLHPTRVGVSRLYVTFIADCLCSSTQSIPLEITRDPVKTTEQSRKKSIEALLKSDTPTEKTDEVPDKTGESAEKADEPKPNEASEKADEPPKETELVSKEEEKPLEEPVKETEISEKSSKEQTETSETSDVSSSKQEPSTETQEPSTETQEPSSEIQESPSETQESSTSKQDESTTLSAESTSKQDEPLLKSDADSTPKDDEKSEKEDKVSPSESTDNQDTSRDQDEEKTGDTTPLTTSMEDASLKNHLSEDTSKPKSDSAPPETEETDGSPSELPVPLTNNLAPPQRTTDKDQVSVDSLDISNDRRAAPNTDNQ